MNGQMYGHMNRQMDGRMVEWGGRKGDSSGCFFLRQMDFRKSEDI